jgi:hypothetical protein
MLIEIINTGGPSAFISAMGLQGPPGNTTTVIAGQIVSALRVVYTDPITEKVLYADKDLPDTVKSLLGVTTQSVAIDEPVNVQTFGTLTDASWNWNMNSNVSLFLGANGSIVQGVLAGAIVARVGHAISPTKIFIRTGEPVLTS